MTPSKAEAVFIKPISVGHTTLRTALKDASRISKAYTRAVVVDQAADGRVIAECVSDIRKRRGAAGRKGNTSNVVAKCSLTPEAQRLLRRKVKRR
jgi:hypothetical protein